MDRLGGFKGFQFLSIHVIYRDRTGLLLPLLFWVNDFLVRFFGKSKYFSRLTPYIVIKIKGFAYNFLLAGFKSFPTIPGSSKTAQ
jgi:hypothetical protein